jgi:hypothetical protein
MRRGGGEVGDVFIDVWERGHALKVRFAILATPPRETGFRLGT